MDFLTQQNLQKYMIRVASIHFGKKDKKGQKEKK